MTREDLLKNVCDLAIRVGKYQAEQRLTFDPARIETKDLHDYVSYVDKESERMIVEELKKLMPEAGFLTEERTVEQSAIESETVWVIDPLDGTTNFIHDLGPWCVSIALKQGRDLTIGVVYEVTRDELFYAQTDKGAWLRRGHAPAHRICVSPVSDIEHALVTIGYPYNAEAYRDFATRLSAHLYGHCISLRSLGSAAASLCYVADSRIDIYIESFLHTWDVCAGALIVDEAGGMITDYRGEHELWLSGREMVATNVLLFSSVIKLVDELSHHPNPSSPELR